MPVRLNSQYLLELIFRFVEILVLIEMLVE